MGQKLGVKTLQAKICSDCCFNLPFEFDGAVEAYGQQEKLTSRLKNVIENYPEGIFFFFNYNIVNINVYGINIKLKYVFFFCLSQILIIYGA